MGIRQVKGEKFADRKTVLRRIENIISSRSSTWFRLGGGREQSIKLNKGWGEMSPETQKCDFMTVWGQEDLRSICAPPAHSRAVCQQP